MSLVPTGDELAAFPYNEWGPRSCAHPDCDGWRTEHRRIVQTERYSNGTVLYRLECEDCGPLHIGSAGSEASARSVAANAACREASVHCDGRCADW